MSEAFVESFFPSATNLLLEYRPQTWYSWFPPEKKTFCRPASFTFLITRNGRYKLPVRWPSLVPLQLIGVYVGLLGYGAFQAKGRPARPPVPAWSLCFGFFALMNASAMLVHCFLARKHVWYSALASLDVASTACAAFSAAYACLTGELDDVPTQSAPNGGTVHMLNVATIVGLINMIAFCGANIPWVNEVLYIGTTLLSVLVVAAYVFLRRPVGAQRRWRALLLLAGAVAFTGLPMDKYLCRAFGPHINHATQLFMGCDLIFFCLLRYVSEELSVRYDSRADKQE